jgi:nucleoside-diphosphate-sugar epimerase
MTNANQTDQTNEAKEAPALHVVLGAGQIGNLVADQLLARGHRVRQVRRGAPGAARPGLEWRSGDLKDPAFTAGVLAGAAAAYQCVNVAYDQWATLLPPLLRGINEGAARAKVKLVVLDNLYLYGRPEGVITEESPVAPRSRKGELRARLAAETLALSQKGDLKVAVGRASDFYGPGVTLASIFGERFFQRVAKGQSGESLGDPDQLHSYSYGPDVAAGLLALADPRADGQVWHLPVSPPETTRAWIGQFGRQYGRPITVGTIPDFVLKGMGLFVPVMREVAEMTYQWRGPFVLGDAKIRAAFGLSHTPPAEGVRRTVEWARGQYGLRP